MSASHTRHAPTGASASPPADFTSHSREDATVTPEKEEDEPSQKSDDEATPREEEEEDEEEGETKESQPESDAPPLPDEVPPPLPNEAPPGEASDDGWEPVWDANAQSYYFYNRYTAASQWENPRVPSAEQASAPIPPAPGTEDTSERETAPAAPPAPAPLGGYNPAIHGDYDPTAPYAQHYERQEEQAQLGVPGAVDPNGYGATGSFNRFTGKWQADSQNPEYHNDENKTKRQMNAYFDVDAAANAHDGRSLRAERSAKKLSKKELKAFKDKRREKKEEKRRAWLRD